MSTLTLKLVDPYFGFPLCGTGHDLAIYERLHRKGYFCLTPYIGGKKSMMVRCPNGHEWSGYPKKVALQLNNCKQCWDIRKLKPAERISEIIVAQSGTIISPYIKSDVKMRIKCRSGHAFDIAPDYIMSGSWCNLCAKNNVDVAREKFYSIIEDKGGKAIGEYFDSTQKVEIKCKDGHKFLMAPSCVNQGKWCPVCAGNSPEMGRLRFYQNVKDRGGIVLSEYVNNDTPVMIQCDKGHIVSKIPYALTRGSWCRKCANLCPQQSKERFSTKVAEQGGQLIDPYVDRLDRLRILCDKGHIFWGMPKTVIKGKWCPKCANNCPVQARERFEALVKSRDAIMIGSYIDSRTKIDVICASGHNFAISPGNASNDKWCRSCGLRESKGERRIRELLTKLQIAFQQEIMFDWLPLKRFDFMLRHNGRNYIIEYDGEQHFEYTPYFHETEEKFALKRGIDIHKTTLALNQRYFFIRIAYTDYDDLEDIILEIINDPAPTCRLSFSDSNMYDWLLDGVRSKLAT